MSELFRRESGPKSRYFDKQCGLTEEEYKERLQNSCTVYVGVSHHGGLMCRESQIYHFFEKCGKILKVVQSKHKKEKKNCGFFFVVFQNQQGVLNAVSYMNRARLDRQVLKVDIDVGFSVEGSLVEETSVDKKEMTSMKMAQRNQFQLKKIKEKIKRMEFKEVIITIGK